MVWNRHPFSGKTATRRTTTQDRENETIRLRKRWYEQYIEMAAEGLRLRKLLSHQCLLRGTASLGGRAGDDDLLLHCGSSPSSHVAIVFLEGSRKSVLTTPAGFDV